MKTYSIKTFGCQMNHSDSERIAGFLEKNGLKKATDLKSADLVVFNTCGVRQMAEDRVYGQIHNLRLKTINYKLQTIILTGCLADRKDVQRRLKDKVDLFIPIHEIGKIKNIIDTHKKTPSRQYFEIRPKYNSTFTAYVPIMTGCNNFCSYCVVPYARGREISRPIEEIISEIKDLLEKGYKEIILLGQNVNSYRDGKISFPQLLRRIDSLPGNFWLSFVSNHPKDITLEFIQTITKLPKVCEIIHLPLQAGDDKVLKDMNRKYTAKEYLKLIRDIKKAFRKNKPGKLFSITSDIIVGFPGETKKQFMQSADVIKKAGYDMVYFGQYSPRPGTAAWKLKDNVSKSEKARRENFLNEILKKTAFENNQKYLGKTLEVLIDKKKGGNYFGHTRTGKNVKIGSEKEDLVGNFVEAEIIGVSAWNLEARIPSKRIVVILGPTSSGKSDVAIKLARKFDGEIISADSRQIYRRMDIGSGKVTKAEQKMVPHHMLDIINPMTRFSAGQFKKKTDRIIVEIFERGKVPIICGGTGFWIRSIVDDVDYPEVKPDWKLREKLEKISAEKLFDKLQKLDPKRAASIDSKNKVRLIRAIEICKTIGKVPEIREEPSSPSHQYEFLQIGISWPKEELQRRIETRLEKRFRCGMIKEVENLHKIYKVSWKRLIEFGLEYRQIALFLQGNIGKEEMKMQLFQDIKNYAKRQMTWFKKDPRIIWLSKYQDIEKEVGKFLT